MSGFKPLTASGIYAQHGINPKDVAAIAAHLNLQSRNKRYSPGDSQAIVAFAQSAKSAGLTIPQAIAQLQAQSVESCPNPPDGSHQTDSPTILDNIFAQSQTQANATYGDRANSTALSIRQQAEEIAAPVMVATNLTAAAIVASGADAITDPNLRHQVQRSEQILFGAMRAATDQFSLKNLLRATGLPTFQQLPSLQPAAAPQLSS